MTHADQSTHSWGWRADPAVLPAATWTTGSVFETLRAYRGRVFALDTHVERLAASARTVGFALDVAPVVIARTILRTAQALPRRDAVIRVMASPRPARSPRISMMGRVFRPYPQRWYRVGVAVATAVAQRHAPATVPPQAKHTDLLPGILARSDDKHALAELIYRTADGLIGEGTVSNLCVVTKDGHLASPPPARGVLAGVTCQTLMRLAPAAGLIPCWTPLTRHDVWNAAEVFLTNTTLEVLPVVRYDGRTIGTGRPGARTLEMRAAFHAHVRTELASCT